ncbi:MAG: AsmA family protein [Gammaproteobacteria bacterium]|nr:AsmA family protein [Gammaproteobacteria bacterium]MDH5799611.1 AsmA family protein [Gammaproteobacteria bacterium]
MNKTKLFSIATGVGLLVLLVPVIFLLTFDLNQYKSLMIAVVKQHTGRQLQLTGPMEKSLFPWLGVKIGQAGLGNAPGFEQEQFAAIEEAQLKVKFWPLVQGRLEVDTVLLKGFELHLRRNVQGETNFQDLLRADTSADNTVPETETVRDPATVQESAETLSTLQNFLIGGLSLEQAGISWRDHQTGRQIEVRQINLHLSQLEPNKPVAFDLGLQVQARQYVPGRPETKPLQRLGASLHMDGRVLADLATMRLSVKDLSLVMGFDKGSLPLDLNPVTLKTQAEVDLEKQALTLEPLSISTMGLQLTGGIRAAEAVAVDFTLSVVDAARLKAGLQPLAGDRELLASGLADLRLKTRIHFNPKQDVLDFPLTVELEPLQLQSQLQVSRLQTAPGVKGRLEVASFSPRALLRKLLQNPAVASVQDEKALQALSLQLTYSGGLDALDVSALELQLDETRLKAKLSAKTQGPQLQAQININELNLDRYRPSPAPQPKTEAEPAAVPQTEPQLPLKLMRELSLDVQAELGHLVANGITMRNIKTAIKSDKGLYRLKPMSLQLYQGRIEAAAQLDVRESTPVWSFEETLKQVHFGELLKDAGGEDLLSGAADIQLSLSGQGVSPQTNRDKLNGKLNFHLRKGEAKYLNLLDMLSGDYAKYLKKAVPENEPDNVTVFNELKGSMSIVNGVATNKDLWLSSSPIEVNGRGQVDLVQEKIDFVLDTTIVKPTKGMKAIKLDELQGEPIPIKIYGPLFAPEHKIDFGAVLKRKANRAVDRKKTQLKDKAKRSVEKRKDKAQEQAKDKLKEKSQDALDKLKNKFKF